MSVTLLIMSDGRKMFIEPTLAAIDAGNKLIGPITRKLIHDDSGDAEYAQWLNTKYGDEYEVYSTGRRSGFGGAIISAWNQLQNDNNDWVFHLEDDFVIEEVVPLGEMMTVMDQNPHLVQMALLRQAWNPDEIAVGGVIEMDPEAYTESDNGLHKWREHSKFFTTNPSLYRKELVVQHPWPVGNNSEGLYGIELFSDGIHKSGYWGGTGTGPKVRHIGEYRNGAGY